MTGKHTPGPWFAVPYGDGEDRVICKDEAGTKRIAFMAIPGARDQQERRKAWREIHANARLISKAPELLDALRALGEVVCVAIDRGDWEVDGACDPEGVLRRANDLIAEIEEE